MGNNLPLESTLRHMVSEMRLELVMTQTFGCSRRHHPTIDSLANAIAPLLIAQWAELPQDFSTAKVT